jgi:hypothetical protein
MTVDPFRFADLLTGHTARLEPILAPVLDDFADRNKESQRELVRKRSHATADSIEVTSLGLGREIGPTRPDGFAAVFLESGGAHHGPFPFVGRASDLHENSFVTTSSRVVLDDLNR